MNRIQRALGSAVVLSVAVAALARSAACTTEPVEGELVVCTREWTCAARIVAENEEAFCTDPGEAERERWMETYVSGFSETCDEVTVNCLNDEVATCAARCAITTTTCPIDDATFIRL